MYRISLFVVLMLLISCIGWPLRASVYNNGRFGSVMIRGNTIQVEFVEQERDWYNGLSRRSSMCDNCGMMFNFFNSSPKTFVMREMNFPLDIIWINRGELIGISANLQAEQKEPYTPYPSVGNVDQVLELNAGTAEKLGLIIYDRIE